MKDLLMMLITAVVATGASAQSVAPGSAPKDSPGDVRNAPGAGSGDSASSRAATDEKAAPAKGSKPPAKMSTADKNAAIKASDKALVNSPRCPEGLTCTRGSDGSLRGPVGDFGPSPLQGPKAPIGTPERIQP
jgi:hypothetical protein